MLLLRFVTTPRGREKVNVAIEIPVDKLSLDAVGAGPQAAHPAVFHLTAASNHKGEVDSGHCTCVTRNVGLDVGMQTR